VSTSDNKKTFSEKASKKVFDDNVVSIVVPIYNEEESIKSLVEGFSRVLHSLDRPFEVILIDDGSTDKTTSIIEELRNTYSWLQGVFLARNYGQSTAMQAGFDNASGSIIVTMDGDLQNDPADIMHLIATLEERDVDVVSGWRKDRKDGKLRIIVSQIANTIISFLTGIKIHDFGCSLKAYRRDMLQQIRIYGEMHRFIPALLSEVGGTVCEIEVNHHARKYGVSKYGLGRTIRVILDLLLVMFLRKYLQRPLHVFGGIGFAMMAVGVGIFFHLGFIKLFYNEAIGHRPLLILGAVTLIAGFTMIGQGILGQLLTQIMLDSDSRPLYRLNIRQSRTRNKSKFEEIEPAK